MPAPALPTTAATHRILNVLNVSLALFGLAHLYAAFHPSVLNWGIHPLAFGPWWARWLVPALMILAALPAVQRAGVGAIRAAAFHGLRLTRRSRFAVATAALAGAGALFHLVDSAGISGDGQFLIHNMRQIRTPADIAHVYLHEPLTCLVHWAVARLSAERIGDAEAQAAYALVSAACGVAFLAALAAVCRRLIRGRTDRILAYAFVLGSGSSLLFFSHVENYTVAYLATLLFVLAALRYADGDGTLMAPSLAAGTLIPLYFGMLSVIPSLGLLYAAEYRRKGGVRALIVPAATFFATLFGLLALTGFTPERFLTLLTGGNSHLVGILEATGPMEGYTLLSGYHIADLANLALFLSPFALLFLLIPILRRRSGASTPGERSAGMVPLAAIAVAGAALIATFRCDLGMPRDWDLLSPPALGAVLLSVAVLARAVPKGEGRSAMLFGASAVMLLRLGPWASLEHEPRAAIAQNRVVLEQSGWITDLHKGWEQLAMVAKREGDLDSALAYYRLFLKGDPAHQRILGNVADIFRLKGLEDSEMVYTEMAIRNGSTVPALHFNLGTMYAGRGRWDDAIGAMQRGLQLEPDRPDVVNAVGSFMLRSGGSCEDALPLFRDAIRIDRGYALAWLNAADCSGVLGDDGEMRRCLAEVLRLDPELAARFDVPARLSAGGRPGGRAGGGDPPPRRDNGPPRPPER